MFEDGHSSLIKRRDPGCVHCERSAVPPSVLLSASPFEELTVRPATKKKKTTHLIVSVCASRLVSPLKDSPAPDTYGLLVAEHKIGPRLKAERSFYSSAFISQALSHGIGPPKFLTSSNPVLSQ